VVLGIELRVLCLARQVLYHLGHPLSLGRKEGMREHRKKENRERKRKVGRKKEGRKKERGRKK
jgi:hypothetical protein